MTKQTTEIEQEHPKKKDEDEDTGDDVDFNNKKVDTDEGAQVSAESLDSSATAKLPAEEPAKPKTSEADSVLKLPQVS